MAGSFRRMAKVAILALLGASASQRAGACSLAALSDPDQEAAKHAWLKGIVEERSVSNPWQRAEDIVRASFAFGERSGKRELGKNTWIPEGSQLVDVVFSRDPETEEPTYITVQLDLPKEFIENGGLTEVAAARIGSELLGVVEVEESSFNGLFLHVRDPKTGEFVSVSTLVPVEEAKPWDPGVDEASVQMSLATGKPPTRDMKAVGKFWPVILPGLQQGALSGKTIYINQSHGWFDDVDFGRWRVQRGNCYNTNEDIDSAEFINQYVLPLLRNAGAKVQTVREADNQTNMVIVDNADAAYAETGTWTTSSINGFKQKTTASWVGTAINPFNQGAGANRLAAITSGAPTATATWTATIPATGYYNVYASWTGFSARAHDAQYLVYHSGGVSEVRVNQTIDGYTWNLLGNFYFEAGAPADQRKVVLTNSSADATATNVSADAVRWGGGMGDVARQTHGVSGRPRWEEDAVAHLQWDGFGYSGDLYTGVDDEAGGWSDRPQYARWEHSEKDGSVEDAIYFAYHTNANTGCGSAARGLSTFRHSTATAASTTLQTIMHDTMYQHVTALYVPGWTVRSKYVTDFGENNQTSLGTGLPGFLIEGLFHDNQADTEMYEDPQFRYLYARAMVQAVINYFEQRDTVTLLNPPEPIRNFRVEMQDNGNAQLAWDAPLNNTNTPQFGSAASSYRVQRSPNGFGFDDGVAVAGTSYTVTDLPASGARYFRVIAVNSGGISVPSEVLCAAKGTTKVLVVNGFDRNQRSLLPVISITNLGTVAVSDPKRFQAFNYMAEHGKALEPLPLSISSCSNEVVAGGQVNLANYKAVFWIAGEESTTNETFSTAEQTKISQYLQLTPANFFVSGSELAYDLDNQGSTADKSFFNTVLHSGYTADTSGSSVVTPAAAPFVGLASINFSTGAGARYDVNSPDVLSPLNGATTVLQYSTGQPAAVAYSGTSRVVVMGFPFETIGSATTRADLMARLFDYFQLGGGATPTPSPSPSPSPSPTASPSPSPSLTATPSPSPSLTPTPTLVPEDAWIVY